MKMKQNYTLIPLCLMLLAFIACSNNVKTTSKTSDGKTETEKPSSTSRNSMPTAPIST